MSNYTNLHGALAALIINVPADKHAIAVDMNDFSESVLGLPATDNSKLENITKETIKLSKALREHVLQTVAEMQDALTGQEFIDTHGTWLFTEYEHPRYLLVCVDRLSVDETLTTLAE